MIPDPLETLIEAVASSLRLRIRDAWRPTVKANLEVSMKLACFVEDFELPDGTESSAFFAA